MWETAQESTLFGGTGFPPWHTYVNVSIYKHINVYVCVYKHIYVCVCVCKPLQIHVSTQTYVKELGESGWPGHSRRLRHATPLVGNIPLPTWVRSGRLGRPQGGYPLGDWHPPTCSASWPRDRPLLSGIGPLWHFASNHAIREQWVNLYFILRKLKYLM